MLVIARIVHATLQDMDPRYPQGPWKPGEFKIVRRRALDPPACGPTSEPLDLPDLRRVEAVGRLWRTWGERISFTKQRWERRRVTPGRSEAEEVGWNPCALDPNPLRPRLRLAKSDGT